MNTPHILNKLTLATLFFSACSTGKDRNRENYPEHPNVLVIITDDQGWGDIRSHGNDTIQTPNLDELASQSFRFNRFYVSPVCAPTRASLLTGRYHLRTGVHGVTGRREIMRNSEFSIAEVFSESEYNTAYFGKWHNGAQFPHNPIGQGFSHFIGFCAGHWNTYFDAELEYNNRRIETRGYITDVLTDSLLNYLDQPRSNPFLAIMAYNTPHTPYQVPDPYFSRFSEMGLDNGKSTIFGMIENLDDNIGKILTKLESAGLDKETIVVFLTDNGPNTWRFNGNMKGKKAWVDEGGVRVPLFIRIPWIDSTETQVEEMSAHIDIFPTLASLCNVNIPDGLLIDGRDLSTLLENPEKELSDRYIFTDRGLGAKKPFAIRSRKYLLTVKNDTLLFNLEEDPSQEKDVSAAFPGIKNNLLDAYNTWYREVTAFGFDIPPIEIGHRNITNVELPAHEARLSDNLSFMEGHGWAHDWVTGFGKEKDSVFWTIDVISEGNYDLGILLDSPPANRGEELNVWFNGGIARVRLEQEYNAVPAENYDRVERKEAPEMEWPLVWTPKIRLAKGKHDLLITTGFRDLPGMIDIKGVVIRSRDQSE